MATVKGSFRRAVAAHREALGLLQATRELAGDDLGEPGYTAPSLVRQAEIVSALREVGGHLATGWGTAGWDALGAGTRPPLGQGVPRGQQSLVRLGTATPVTDSFPVLVPFLGVSHLCVDTDARDPRVAALIAGVLVRVLAAAAPGSLRVLAVDPATLGATFTPLLDLVAGGLMDSPATDLDGLRRGLAAAEEHVRRAQRLPEHDRDDLVLAIAGLPGGWSRDDLSRLASLARTGHRAHLHLLVAGYPPPTDGPAPPPLEEALTIAVGADHVRIGDAPGQPFGAQGRGLNCPVHLDPAPPAHLVTAVCRRLVEHAGQEESVGFGQLVAPELWQESSVDGLRTVVGRAGRVPVRLALDDSTPHWLVGGRTGSGKTVFLLGVLYGLASRYSPDELALYLLDFKEGVSFSEFTPTEMDPTWIPHARTVGVESDREYGVAVLAALSAEMTRRATVMKQVGATKLAQLRAARPDVALPRIVTVIDEFHVLFAGNDAVARRAGELLEEVARKGRSYGIHLILASQTTSGIETLFAKGEAIFGQFPVRVALAGGRAVLAMLNEAADALPIGTAVINDAAGVPAANRLVRFPDTDPDAVRRVRTRLWEQRMPGDEPPAVFAGYAEQHVTDDPSWARLAPGARRRVVLLGRTVDVGLPTAAFTLDASPGRHVAVLGTSEIGADILHAAVLGLARQHVPGRARFVLAGLVAAADDAAADAAEAVRAAGHRCSEVELTGLRDALAELAHPVAGGPAELLAADEASGAADAGAPEANYVVIWGADAAGAALRAARDPETGNTGLDDLRTLLQEGPARSVHLVGWWRGVRRFADDLGTSGRDDIAGVVALNVPAKDLGSAVGNYLLEWQPRPNRALFIDQHEDRAALIVPFVRDVPHEGGRR